MNVDHEKQKFNKNVHKILQIKTSIFLHFRWRAWAQFSKKCLYSIRNILIIFNIIFFIKFNYLNRTNKKLYFLTSMWFYYFLNIYLTLLPCFSSGNANLHHAVVPSVGANNLKTHYLCVSKHTPPFWYITAWFRISRFCILLHSVGSVAQLRRQLIQESLP